MSGTMSPDTSGVQGVSLRIPHWLVGTVIGIALSIIGASGTIVWSASAYATSYRHLLAQVESATKGIDEIRQSLNTILVTNGQIAITSTEHDRRLNEIERRLNDQKK